MNALSFASFLRYGWWLALVLSLSLLTNCTAPASQKEVSITREMERQRTEFKSEEEFLSYIQKAHFNYMWEGAELNSGLAREKIVLGEEEQHLDTDIVSVGESGFGIAGLIIGMERGFITRNEGLDRFHLIVDFLLEAERFHGMWPARLDGATGKMSALCETERGGDVAGSALLMQGLLCARQYFNSSRESERSLVNKINKLWHNMEWKWYQNGSDLLFSHWSPEYNWRDSAPMGWDHAGVVAYVLGASSPTYPITTSLFLNLNRGEETVRNLGIPASVLSSIGETSSKNLKYLCTDAHEVGHSPKAMISDIPYTPEMSIKILKNLYFKPGDNLWGKYGFLDEANEEETDSSKYVAMEQVKIAPMIENYRTGLLWNLFMSCPEVKSGIANLNYILKPSQSQQ